jgi:polyisoprenoid-binding protein YceI
MRILSSIVFGLALAFSGTAHAEAVAYKLEKPHTQILFNVNHLGFSQSYGRFLDYTGEISWDQTNPANSTVNATIQVASLDMGDKTWNEHMLAPKYFNAAQFPVMTFKSTKIEVTGDKTANITGDLTLRGVTKPVTMAATMRGEGKNPFSGFDTAGFAATTTIKRSDFGMTEAIPMVGDEVNIIIEAEIFNDAGKSGNQ